MERPAGMIGAAVVLAVAALALAAGWARANEAGADNARMLRRLRAEAVVAWREMAEKLLTSRFEYRIVETQRNGGRSLGREKRVTGWFRGPCFLFEETIVATDQESVYGRNERYEFALERSGAAPWTVSWQSARRDDETPVGSARAYLGGMLELPWSISAVRLERLVDDPRFSIRAARILGSGRVEIRFAVAPAGVAADELQGLTGGRLVLDPMRRWAIVQYQAHYGTAMRSSADLEYGPAGPPKLRRVRFELHTGPERSSHFAIDVNSYDGPGAKEPEIALAAYGLPEYRDPNVRRRWLGLVNAGVVFVLVGFLVWRRQRGSKRTS